MSQPKRFGLRLLLMIVIFDVVIGGLVVASLQLPGPWVGPTITTVIILGTIALIRYAFAGLWNPMVAAWPSCEVPREAQRKSFQSFSIGLVNMGLSINAAVDEEFLHLEPIAIWRLFGANSASIPFSAMTPSDRGRSVRVDGVLIRGPRWCFERASQAT